MNIPITGKVDLNILVKKEKNARMKLKLLAIIHFNEGKSRYQIAQYLKVSRTSVNGWISKYLTNGLAGLIDKKHPGRPAALNLDQLIKLKGYLNQSIDRADNAQLSGGDIQAYILKTFGVEYEKSAVYRLLNRLGYSLRDNYLHLLD